MRSPSRRWCGWKSNCAAVRSSSATSTSVRSGSSTVSPRPTPSACLNASGCNAAGRDELVKDEGMARKIKTDKGVINAQAESDEDDVTVAFDRLKHVTNKAVLLRIGSDEVWLPLTQVVDMFPKRKEVIVTSWIAREKGLD